MPVRWILVLVVLAAAVAGAVTGLAFRGGHSQPRKPVVTGGDDANLMRALQRPKLVHKAP
jgi:hypothetical protein